MDSENNLGMCFSNRVKKEMSEGIVRAILEDAEYRVIDTGIERVIRELCCLNRDEYNVLAYPDTMSRLPDFVVMDREQREKHLVEVKYRTDWSIQVIQEVREQVRIFGELILVCVYAKAPNPRRITGGPSRHLRCCRLRFDNDQYQIQPRHKGQLADWQNVDELKDIPTLWWAMSPLQTHFHNLKKDSSSTYSLLTAAIQALGGILDS